MHHALFQAQGICQYRKQMEEGSTGWSFRSRKETGDKRHLRMENVVNEESDVPSEALSREPSIPSSPPLLVLFALPTY